MLREKPTMWGWDESVALVRALQPFTRRFNYHLALGGGVLNTGASKKDLDLYFLSLDNGKKNDLDGLIQALETVFGKSVSLTGKRYGNATSDYKAKVKFEYGENPLRRIDAFFM